MDNPNNIWISRGTWKSEVCVFTTLMT